MTASQPAAPRQRPSLAVLLPPALVLLGFSVLAFSPGLSGVRILTVAVLTASATLVASRSLAGRERKAREATRDVLHRTAAGDLTLTRTELARSGEAELTTALHGLLVGMERILASFARLSEAVSGVARDLTFRARDLSRAVGIQNARAEETAVAIERNDAAISSLRLSMETLAQIAENAGASLHEMSTSISEVSRSTQGLRAFVDETAASLDGVVAALQEVTSAVENLWVFAEETARASDSIRESTGATDHQAQTGARLAERVTTAVGAGKEAVSGTVDGMRQIRGVVGSAAEAASALAERSARIGEILRAIEEIAGETNLLALNASIIAAQTGESGRAFSVLADDIRDLSDRTALSTEEVRELVSAVIGGVEDVRRHLGEARRRTEEGVDLALTADGALDQIQRLAVEQKSSSEEIAAAATSQSIEVVRVSEATTRVSSEIGRIRRATRGQLDSAGSVRERAQRVREQIEKFSRAMQEQEAGSQNVLSSMDRVQTTVDSIAEAIATLADGSASVVRSMAEIRLAATHNAYAATAMNQTAQALEQEALMLRSRASLFRFPVPSPGGRIRAALRYFGNEDYDPAFCQTVPQAVMVRTWGEGLVRFGEGTRIMPELAERWEIDPAGTLYTFHLRRGVRYHEAGALGAADVKASFERYLSPELNAPLAGLFEAIEGFSDFRAGRSPGVSGISVDGPGTLHFRLDRPLPFFLQLLTLPDTTVLPPALLGSRDRVRKAPLGTGPFVPREIAYGKVARFDRFDAYWDRSRISPAGLDLDLAEDSEAGVFSRFMDGQLDVIWDIPYPEAARLESDPEWRPYLDSSVQLHTSFLVLRCDRPPLTDRRVRRAMNHALDRTKLNDSFFSGLTVPASSILPPYLLGHDPSLRPYRHDPERARALLAEAGVPPGTTLVAWQSPQDARDPRNPIPEIARDLEAVGLSLRIEDLPAEEVTARKKRGEQPHVRLARWFADFPDPDTFFSSLFYSGTEDVLESGYRSPEVDRLVERGARATDSGDREAVYRELNRLIQSEAPLVFLFHNRAFVLHNPRLRGVQAHMLPPPVRWNDLWFEE